MTLRFRLPLGLDRFRLAVVKVDLGDSVGVETVEHSDVSNSGKRDTHSDLKLSGRKIDTRDHLGGRVLDLKTGVELKEEEGVIGVGVKVCENKGRISD